MTCLPLWALTQTRVLPSSVWLVAALCMSFLGGRSDGRRIALRVTPFLQRKLPAVLRCQIPRAQRSGLVLGESFLEEQDLSLGSKEQPPMETYFPANRAGETDSGAPRREAAPRKQGGELNNRCRVKVLVTTCRLLPCL